MRIVLDTDVLVSALRSTKGASRLWLKAILANEVQIALSGTLLIQYEEVLTRPEQLYYSKLSIEDIAELLDTLSAICHPVDIAFLWRPCLKDPSDEMVLEAAVNGQANQLLTFNHRDFKGAEKFNVKIIKPGDAWREWKGGQK